MNTNQRRTASGLAILIIAGSAWAETPKDFLGRFEAEARTSSPGFNASATRGEAFFHAPGAREWRCSTCHTDDPAAIGKHAKTAKPIDPLSPVVNPDRFARADKVEKWFKRNCSDVLDRACTAAEKADVVAYLMTIRK